MSRNFTTATNTAIAGSSLDLSFMYFGREQCRPGHYWGPGIRQHFKIHYVHRGRGIVRTGDRMLPVDEGQGFVSFPETITYYEADAENPWEYSWVAFHGLHAETYIGQAGLSRERPVFTAADRSWLEGCTGLLQEAEQSDRSRALKCQSVLYRLLAELIEWPGAEEPAPKRRNPKDAYFRKAVEYIKANFSRKISIAQIASEIGIDRVYLSTLFKESAHVSPQAFLLRFRMDKARELMSGKELTIADIARSVGYNDPLLFSKMFKKSTGLAPTAYRTRLSPE